MISTGRHFFSYFLLANKLLNSLNYKAYFRHVQKPKHYLCLRPFNVFPFRESSILTIKYVYSLFLVCKLCKSGFQIMHLNLDHLRFLGSVYIGGFL